MTSKSVFVSGGASGIGLATARHMLAAGWNVAIGDIDLDAAKRAERDAPGLYAVRLDVTSDASWSEAIAATIERFGRLDGLVNNAGIFLLGNIESTTDEEWRRTQAVNVDGVFFGCRHGVRALKAEGGSIVNLSSVAGLIGGANILAYNASKGAVRLLTKSVALHCARKAYNVRCNSVHPTFVDTPMYQATLASTKDPVKTDAAFAADIPLGRVAQPGEIAALVAYLLGDDSRFVTGAEMVIDGGMTAR
ncbi:MAG: SDR family oxidoreductase [Candidatus Eremiobacteraeota bacterium]|nr:SDR family oxidoreductase [Candidatus Eremiobacteraeota bacterium]